MRRESGYSPVWGQERGVDQEGDARALIVSQPVPVTSSSPGPWIVTV